VGKNSLAHRETFVLEIQITKREWGIIVLTFCGEVPDKTQAILKVNQRG